MPLLCSCDFIDDCDWYYTPPADYSIFEALVRKRCSSCKSLIDIGATIARFEITRPPKTWVEEKIYGEDGDIYMADKLLCEKCADLYFSFRELGFNCVAPDEDMLDLAKLYSQQY